jgi:ABC-type uncharacterized transport system permease subunit
MSVILEALVVGVVLGMLMALSHAVYPIRGRSSAFVTGLVLGMVFHIVCEMTSVNSWYCTHGTACAPRS